MIANEASLLAVNDELPSPVTMERFRPNVVVTGLGGFEEVVYTVILCDLYTVFLSSFFSTVYKSTSILP